MSNTSKIKPADFNIFALEGFKASGRFSSESAPSDPMFGVFVLVRQVGGNLKKWVIEMKTNSPLISHDEIAETLTEKRILKIVNREGLKGIEMAATAVKAAAELEAALALYVGEFGNDKSDNGDGRGGSGSDGASSSGGESGQEKGGKTGTSNGRRGGASKAAKPEKKRLHDDAKSRGAAVSNPGNSKGVVV